ncbi:glycosyltransferase [Paraburkholderia bannensis]|uniref:glycosyltransferase n=1 Tax=Paraburkholderia bannensis TaxID=765414 RepID=UPI002AB664F7|nr:glycosyltransferase [Paraburkholderia bannensis]
MSCRFAIVLPEIASASARRTLLSVCEQTYTDWVVYVAGAADLSAVTQYASAEQLLPLVGPFVQVQAANDLYVLPLLPGDELQPDALALLALGVRAESSPDMIYGDHDERLGTKNHTPFFKPGWSPEFLLATDYIGRAAMRAELFNRSRLPASFDAIDLWRLWVDQRHVDKIRVARVERLIMSIAPIEEAEYHSQVERARKNLEGHLAGFGLKVRATLAAWAQRLGIIVFDFAFEDAGPKVSLLIPSKNNWATLKRCIDSLSLTQYQNYEAIVIDNESDQPETVAYINELRALRSEKIKVVTIASPATGFSYSYVNNAAVQYASADYLLFLNDDTEVLRPDWLSQMMGWAQLPGVATVGARLYFPNDTVQHNGLVHNLLDGALPAPAFKLTRRESIGTRGQDRTVRNFSAVTAACMLTPRTLFVDDGGFNDSEYSVAYNDCDYGFRLTQRGWRHVCVPTVELYHYEGASRGRGRGNDKISEEAAFIRQYSNWSDPYYNVNLSRDSFTFDPASRAHIDDSIKARKFSVGLFTHNLNYEGAPLVLLDIAAGLRAEMAQVVVFSLVDGPLRKKFEAAGCEVIVRTDVGVFGTRSEEQLEETLRPVVNTLYAAGIDVVISNTIVTHWGMEAARIAGLPAVWLIHESEPPFHHLIEHGDHHVRVGRRALDNAYMNIFVARSTLELYKPLARRNNLDVIYNGFDRVAADEQMALYDRTEERKKLEIAPDQLLFILPGTVCERKSQKDLVHAVAKLSEDVIRQCTFAIVGDRDGVYSRELHALQASLPEDRRANIKIIPETGEIWRYYVAADAMAFTSRMESFPRVIQEAMYRGLAIASTPVFGISEQLRDGQSGLFFEPGDTDGLAEAITRMARDPALMKRLADTARISLNRFPLIEEMQASHLEIVRQAFVSGKDRPLFGAGVPWLADSY